MGSIYYCPHFQVRKPRLRSVSCLSDVSEVTELASTNHYGSLHSDLLVACDLGSFCSDVSNPHPAPVLTRPLWFPIKTCRAPLELPNSHHLEWATSVPELGPLSPAVAHLIPTVSPQPGLSLGGWVHPCLPCTVVLHWSPQLKFVPF